MVMPARKEDELQAMCSKCFTGVPVEKAHVQPGYNDFLRAYVTAYRCDNCWAEDLVATRARMVACKDKEELVTGVVFFSRYNLKLLGLSPFAPIEKIREKLLGLMDQIASGELYLQIDTTTTIPIELPKLEGDAPEG